MQRSIDIRHDNSNASSAYKMTRFTSPHPPIDVDACRKSFAALLLERDAKLPDDMPAYIDGISGEIVSRAAHRARAFSIASALRNLQTVGLQPLGRGSTVLVFSPNSVLYPAVMMALVSCALILLICFDS